MAHKWIDRRVSEKMVVIKVLVEGVVKFIGFVGVDTKFMVLSSGIRK